MPSNYVINTNDYNLKLNNSDIVSLVIETNTLNLNYELSNGNYKILIMNNSRGNLTLNESGIFKNSNVQILLFDLNNYNLKQNTNFELFQNSDLNILTTYLGVENKCINYEIIHKESNSTSHITNNVVCVKDADYVLNVVGTILNGSKTSKCHQKSHCLTIDKPKQAKVLPILKIDENDVEASHSLSSGTIDDEVLFYMNSRGLTRKEALQLMLSSYLLPNEELFKEFINGNEIYNLCASKVENVCLK